MNRYQLAKLVEWAGTLESRKRMQKVVFMLQAAGCPLGAEFFLHHYGPYSEDVARMTDQMVSLNLLGEMEQPVGNGSKFSYRLPDATEKQLRELEMTPRGKQWSTELAAFEPLARRLLTADLRQLEFASTIIYFWKQCQDWARAVAMASEFKQRDVNSALPLAKSAILA